MQYPGRPPLALRRAGLPQTYDNGPEKDVFQSGPASLLAIFPRGDPDREINKNAKILIVLATARQKSGRCGAGKQRPPGA